MKKSQLKQIIKEEVKNTLNEDEYTIINDEFSKVKDALSMMQSDLRDYYSEEHRAKFDPVRRKVIALIEEYMKSLHPKSSSKEESRFPTNENEEKTFDTLKNQAKAIKGFKDLYGKWKDKDGFSLTFRNGQREIEFYPSGWKDRVSVTYDYVGNMGGSMLSMKNAHKLVNNISKIK